MAQEKQEAGAGQCQVEQLVAMFVATAEGECMAVGCVACQMSKVVPNCSLHLKDCEEEQKRLEGISGTRV